MLAVEDRVVRPVGLVEAEDVVIDVPGAHVDRPVRRIGHPVDAELGPALVDEAGEAGDVVHLPKDVRHVVDADEPRPPAHQRRQVLEPHRVAFGVDPPISDLDADLAQPLPRADVRLVVAGRHDDLVAGAELPAHRRRQPLQQHRGRGAEDDLLGPCGTHQRLARAAARHQRLGRSLAHGVAAADLDVALEQELDDPVADPAQRLRPAGIVEEHPRRGEAGELRAHEVHVEPVGHVGSFSGSARRRGSCGSAPRAGRRRSRRAGRSPRPRRGP